MIPHFNHFFAHYLKLQLGFLQQVTGECDLICACDNGCNERRNLSKAGNERDSQCEVTKKQKRIQYFQNCQ